MNGSLKLGTFFAGAIAVVLAFWLTLGLPFTSLRHQIWFAALAVSLALLGYTLELTKRNLIRLIGVTALLVLLISTLAASAESAFGRSNVYGHAHMRMPISSNSLPSSSYKIPDRRSSLTSRGSGSQAL